jgi:hypothetical protein
LPYLTDGGAVVDLSRVFALRDKCSLLAAAAAADGQAFSLLSSFQYFNHLFLFGNRDFSPNRAIPGGEW